MNNNLNFPYPGIRPFRTDENDILGGVKSLLTVFVAKLQEQHFIAVVGDSGCGKSSLIQSGLLVAPVKVGCVLRTVRATAPYLSGAWDAPYSLGLT